MSKNSNLQHTANDGFDWSKLDEAINSLTAKLNDYAKKNKVSDKVRKLLDNLDNSAN